MSEFEIAGGPQAPLSARAMLSERVDARVDACVADNVRLLVSELVTNCVVHGGAGEDGRILVRTEVDDACVRTEVCHEGPAFLAPAGAPDLESPGGLGLFLVDQMSNAWGIDAGVGACADETCVWFELPCAA